MLLCGEIIGILQRVTQGSVWTGLWQILVGDVSFLYIVLSMGIRDSNHRTMIAELNHQAMVRGGQRSTPAFRFEAALLMEDGCADVVDAAWNDAFEEDNGLVSDVV